jgi:hypothetical protein
MKKTLTILTALVFMFAFSGLAVASVDSIYEVAVVSVKGDVSVDTNAEGVWIRPWVGMKLMEKALIKTGDDSTVDIVFDSEGLNVVRIKPNTMTTIKKAVLELPDGAVLANFANLKPGSTFTVKTPTAACAIRGSVMGVDVSGGKTTAMAFQGNVYVQPFDDTGNPQGGENTIPEGNKKTVDQDGNMGDTEGLDDSDEGFNDLDGGSDLGTEGTGGADDVDDELDTKDINDIRVGVTDSDDNSQISPTDEGEGEGLGDDAGPGNGQIVGLDD